RPILTGVLVDVKGDKLTMAATDSFRLAVKRNILDQNVSSWKAIIPARTMSEIAKLFKEIDENILISMDKDYAIVKHEDLTLSTKLISGDFPAYENLIPAEFNHSVECEKTDLVE